MAGVFADDLQPIQDAIGQIERRHGLAPDEYWLRDEGPDDWQVLNRTYDEIIERNCGEALRDMVWWTSRIF